MRHGQVLKNLNFTQFVKLKQKLSGSEFISKFYLRFYLYVSFRVSNDFFRFSVLYYSIYFLSFCFFLHYYIIQFVWFGLKNKSNIEEFHSILWFGKIHLMIHLDWRKLFEMF